ncbi:MAG: hypothetical protein ACERIH_10120 [Labilibaculum antarcticum]
MRTTYEKDLEKGRILVCGISENASIKERIKNIYTAEKIAEGVVLCEQTNEAFGTQQNEAIESGVVNEKFTQVQESIHNSLVSVRRAGRYFFKNETELSTLLRLNKDIPKAYAEWKALANETFSTIQSHDTIQAKLSLANLTPELIGKVKDELVQMDQLKLDAEKEDGEAQQATVRKMELFNQFMAYCSDLKECLNLFYEGDARQKLEEVGIVVK